MRVAKLEMGNNFHKSGSTRIIPAPRPRRVPAPRWSHAMFQCRVARRVARRVAGRVPVPRFVPSPCATPFASTVSCAALPPCASATPRRGPVPCAEPVPSPRPPPPLHTRLMAS